MKTIYASIVLTASCGAALAGDWSSHDDKGLKVYNLQDGSVTVDLVCDPDSLWEPPEYHLVVKQAGEVLEGNTVQIGNAEETVSLPLSGGSILSMDQQGWNAVVQLLAQPGPVEFATAEMVVVIDSASGLTSECQR